jgi:Flp pilus assembly protein TadG
MVEFAVALPLLLILVLGIIEFGFVLAQMNEIRHGAREGARYAAVSRPDYDGGGAVGDDADVLAVTCDSISLPGITVSVSLSGGPDRLDYGTITVTADSEPLSGFGLITAVLPDTLTNEATFRLEQDAVWSGFGDTACGP